MKIIEKYNEMQHERASIIDEKRKICKEKLNIVLEKEKLLKTSKEAFFNVPSSENEEAYKIASTECRNAEIELNHADDIYKVLISKDIKLKCTSEEIKAEAKAYIDSLNFDKDVKEFNVKLKELEQIIQRANIKHDKVRIMLQDIESLKDNIELTDKNRDIKDIVFDEATKIPKFVPSGIIEDLRIKPIVSKIGFINWIEEGTEERIKRINSI